MVRDDEEFADRVVGVIPVQEARHDTQPVEHQQP